MNNTTTRIELSLEVIMRLRDIWVNDNNDHSASMSDYYNNMGWHLIQDYEYRTCTIPENQLTFFLLSL